MNDRALVWDLPLRIYHWVLAASFAAAFLTGDSERQRDLHLLCGYTFVAAIGFRIVWGFVGGRHARWSALRHRPAAISRYLRGLLRGQPEAHVGHGPLAVVMIPCLLGLGLIVAASGWATYQEIGGDWLEEVHEGAAIAMLVVVCAHVLGVVALSVLQRENLVAAMITGRKRQIGAPALNPAGLSATLQIEESNLRCASWSSKTIPCSAMRCESD